MPGKPSAREHRRRSPAPRGDIAARIGAGVRAAREAKGLSQAQLGAPYFTRAHVSAVELGKISPAIKSLVHFARKLDVPVRDLIPEDL